MKALSFLAAMLLTFPNLHAFPQASPQAPVSSPQAATLLAQSAAALVHNVALSDVTLTGTARRIAGSDDESGTATVKALATGAMRLDFAFPSGPHGEVRTTSADGPSGEWSGPDGVGHSIALHNLFTDWGWSPAFTLSSVSSSAHIVVTYVGRETRNNQSVQHLNMQQNFPSQTGNDASLMQHLSLMDIYLNASTALPVSFVYNTHPDDNANLDLPVEIDFSDYRVVSGVQIPFHIQKYLNNSLYLDLQLQTATINTGLTAATFQVQ